MKKSILGMSLLSSLFLAYPLTVQAQLETTQSSGFEPVPGYEETKQEIVEIPFETIRRENSSLAPGEEREVQAGVNGEQVYTLIYIVKGEERTLKEKREGSRTEPTPRIIEVGPSSSTSTNTSTTATTTSNESTTLSSETTTEKGTTTTETTTTEDSVTTESSEKNTSPISTGDSSYPTRPRTPKPAKSPFVLSDGIDNQKDLLKSGAKKQSTLMIERRLPTYRTERINPNLLPGQYNILQAGSEGVEYVKVTIFQDRQGRHHLFEEVVGHKPPIPTIVEVSGHMFNHTLLLNKNQSSLPEVMQFFYQRSSIVDRILTSHQFVLNGPRIYDKPFLLPMTGEGSIMLFHPYLGWTSLVSGVLVLMRRI